MEVAVRVRPVLARENGLSSNWICDNNSIRSSGGAKATSSYTFDHVYGPEVQNSWIYQEIAEKIVLQSMQGYHGTVFTYGQSGSGKTYTMDALTKMALDTMYDHMKKSEGREFILRLSYIELYNEHLFDLLAQKEGPILIVREDVDRNVYIEGLIEEVIQCKDDAYSLINIGNEKRRFAETKQNDFSSRAHCILRITIESKERDDDECSSVLLSHLNLVDLAGSERPAENSNDRMKEGCHINKSLLALSLVVSKLSEEQTNAHINYRDSKLTRILQNALGGNSRTVILCTIAPTSVEETLSTLRFANNARYVKNKPKQNKIMSVAAQLQEALLEIGRLKEKIKKMEEGNKLSAESNTYLGDGKRSKTNLAVLPVPLSDPVIESTVFCQKVDRRKSMFGDAAKARRRSFFVSRRKIKPFKEIEPQESDRGDFNLPHLISPENPDDSFRALGLPSYITECEDSSEGVHGYQDLSRLNEEKGSQENEQESVESDRNTETKESLTGSESDDFAPGIENLRRIESAVEENNDAPQNSMGKQGITISMGEPNEESDVVKELHHLRLCLEEKDQECRESQVKIQNIESTVAELENKIQSLIDQVDEKDAEMEEFCDKIENLEGLIERGKEMLKTKDQEIEILSRQEKSVLDNNDIIKEEMPSFHDIKQDDSSGFENQLKQLNHHLGEKDKNLKEMENTIQMMENNMKILKDQCCDMEAQLQEANNKVEMLTLHENIKQDEYCNLESEHKQLKHQLEEKERKLKEFENALQIVENKMKEAYDEKEVQLQEARDKVEVMEEKLKSFEELSYEKMQKTADQVEIQACYRNLEEEMIHLKQQLEEKDNSLTEKQDTIKTLLNTNTDLEEKLDMFKKENEEKDANYQQAFDKIEMLMLHDNIKKEEYDVFENDMKQLRQQLEDKENRCMEMQLTIQVMEEKLKNFEELSHENLQKTEYQVEIQDGYRKLEEETNHLKQQLEEKDNSLTEKQDTIKTLLNTNTDLEEKVDMLKKQNDEKDSNYQQVFDQIEMLMLDDNVKKEEFGVLETETKQLREQLDDKENRCMEMQLTIQVLEEKLKNLEELSLENLQKTADQVEIHADNWKLEEEMNHLKQQLEEKDNSLTEKQDTIKTLLNTNTDLEEMVDMFKKQNEEKDSNYQEALDKIEMLVLDDNIKKEEFGVLETETKQLREQLDDKENRCMEMQLTIQVLDEKVKNLEELSLENLQKTADQVEVQACYRKLGEEMNHLKQQLEEKDNSLTEKQEIIKTMEEELVKLKKLPCEKEKELQEVCSGVEEPSEAGSVDRDHYTFLEDELQLLKSELKEKEDELNCNEDRIQSLQNVITKGQEVLKDKHTQIQTLLDTNTDLEEKVEMLKKQDEEKDANYKQAFDKIEMLMLHDDVKKEEFVDLEKETKQLRQQLEDKENRCMEMQLTMQAMEERLKNFEEMTHEKLQKATNQIEIQEMNHLKQQLNEKDNSLTEKQDTIKAMEEELVKLKKLPCEKEKELQEVCSEVEKPSESGSVDREQNSVLEDEFQLLKSELKEKDSELKCNQGRIQSLQNFIRNGQEVLKNKHAQIQTLTSTVDDLQVKFKAMEKEKLSITKEKHKFQKECQILGKNREEDKEYYEMVIKQYKCNLRKQQDLGSSYLESEPDPKPLKSRNHSENVSLEQDKENSSLKTQITDLENKLQHRETIIRDLRAQIPDGTKAAADARPEGYPRREGGIVDFVVALSKDHYIKKLEHQLKKAQAEIESLSK